MARGLSKNAAQDIAGAQATPGQAQNGVEFPARLVNFQRQLFNQAVVIVVAYVQVFAVFRQHVWFLFNTFAKGRYKAN